MDTRTLVRFCLVMISGLLFTPVATAGFATYASGWPNGPEVVDEYVDGSTDRTGKNHIADQDSSCEIIALGNPKPIDELNRLYIKFGANFLTSDLRGIRNESSGVFAGLNLNKKSGAEDYYSWEIGAGTTLKWFRLELEYVHTKTVHYDQIPVVSGRAEGVQSAIDNDSALLNIIWDFDTFPYFRPYVGVIGGVSWNKTRSTLVGGTLGNNVAQNSNYLTVFVWGLTVGGRIPMSDKWLAYMQYRYVDLNRLNWKAAAGLRLRGSYVLSGFSLGAMYVF